MKILIDTSLPDMYLSIIKDDKTLFYIHKENLVKKANELPDDFAMLLKHANAKPSDIKAIYVTVGPGAFMGVRTALIFAKTFCLMTGAKLFAASSFALVSGMKNGEYYIDAKGGQFYKAKIVDGTHEYSLVGKGEVSQIDYVEIKENPNKYLALFDEVKDILSFEPIYLKDPRIGGE